MDGQGLGWMYTPHSVKNEELDHSATSFALKSGLKWGPLLARLTGDLEGSLGVTDCLGARTMLVCNPTHPPTPSIPQVWTLSVLHFLHSTSTTKVCLKGSI